MSFTPVHTINIENNPQNNQTNTLFTETKLGKYIFLHPEEIKERVITSIKSIFQAEMENFAMRVRMGWPTGDHKDCIQIKIDGATQATAFIRPAIILSNRLSEERIAKSITRFNTNLLTGLFDHTYPIVVDGMKKDTPALLLLIAKIEGEEVKKNIYLSRILRDQVLNAIGYVNAMVNHA